MRKVITLSEFIQLWENGERLIAPKDYKTMAPDELGVIDGWMFRPIEFSSKAKDALNRPKAEDEVLT